MARPRIKPVEIEQPAPIEVDNESEMIQVEAIEEVKPVEVKSVEVFNEAKSVDDLYEMLIEMHKESEALQLKASQELGLIPTQLQIVTAQLNLCKNNIARALGK